MRIPLLVGVCFLSCILITHAQQNPTQDKITAIAKELIQKLESAGGAEVAAALQKDITSSKKNGLQRNDYILKLCKASLDLFFYHSDFYESERFLSKLIAVSETDATIPLAVSAELNRSMSAILSSKQNTKKALIFINKAEQQYRDAKVEIPHMFYISAGNVYVNLDLQAKAREYFEESIRVLQRAENPEGFRFLVSYYSLANSLGLEGRYDEALDYLDRILVMGVPMMGEDDPNLAQTYELMSLMYINKKQFKKAKYYLEKTKKIYLDAYGEIHDRTAHIFGFFGEYYVAKDEYDKAFPFYKRRAAIEKELYGEKSVAVASTYQIIGDKLRRQKKYNDAESNFKKALDALTLKDSDGVLSTNDLFIYFLNTADLASTYLEAFKQNKRVKDLKLAQTQYKKADSIISLFRQEIHNSNDKIFFSDKCHSIYFGAMESFLIEYEKTKKPLALEKAFQFTEKGRAVLLRQALVKSEIKEFLEIPPKAIILEKELAIDKAYNQSSLAKEKLSKSPDAQTIEKIETQLFKINTTQDSLQKVLKASHPKYHVLKYKNDVIDIKEVQKNLKPETTFLEYHYLDGLSYVFSISKDNSFVQKLDTEGIESDIEIFLKSIINKETALFKTKAHELYQKLIEPIADKLKGQQLIIVPDGPLWNINFDLLLSKADALNNPKDFSYLLRNFRIGYANSATAFLSSKRERKVTTSGECLAFSFSNQKVEQDEDSMSFSVLRNSKVDLPGTRKEISQIAKVLDGNYYYGALASEENFKMHAPNYLILHLALHGEVNDQKPNDSRLFFTNTKDNAEDNYLYAHELFSLKLPAELAVLSACNSGSGKIASGEGIMSLGNAFQYAGTKSLLLSKWELADNVAPELMRHFYRNLKKGMSKAKALQQAKLSYLEGASFNRLHPFYWGSFYLLGDNNPIIFNAPTKLWYFIILGLLVFLVFWYTYNRFKRKLN